jgi:membrane protease YdiL (CAAX protease family)
MTPDSGEKRQEFPAGWTTGCVLAFALIFPSFMACVEFVVAPRAQSSTNALIQIAYGSGKLIQFALPVVFVLLTTGQLPRPGKPRFDGIRLGAAFGLMVVCGTLLLYYLFLRDTSVFRAAPDKLREKMVQFGIDSPLGFAAFAFFVIVLHSLLEEYYWRWFLFGELKRLVPLGAAVALSSLGFGAFHVFVLNGFLSGHLFSLVLPLACCVALGGAAWAWLYHRTGSVYAPWISHMLIDASLFVVGYDLLFVRATE